MALSATVVSGSSPTGALLGYDNEERLFGWQNAPTTPTASTAYLYDGAGQRVQRVVTSGGTTTVTASVGAQEEVTTSNAPGSVTTTTAYYGGVAESVNGTLSYLLSDGLGSVSEAVSTTGTVTATQLYAPYGGVRYQSGTLPTDKGYTGQVSDAASTGLDYYGARYYDPVAGQFTSADTTLAGGLNRYAYVAGNPETNIDPSGHLYASQRNYSRSLAMWQSQNQPHTYYGSVTAFVEGLPQFLFGTDTLRQAFHTIFQDPQASAGDKWKAAGVAGLTLVTDAVTITTTFAGDPEVGADMRTFDDGLLAADDAGHVATTTAEEVTGEVTTDATTDLNCPPTDDNTVSGGAPDLYHGTDIGSAKTMVNSGINRVAAAQYGGDGRFYATTYLADARYFAEGNPAGGPPAIVGIKLSTGLGGAVDQGILTPMEGFPGAYTVANTMAAWKAFNSIATFRLVDFEP